MAHTHPFHHGHHHHRHPGADRPFDDGDRLGASRGHSHHFHHHSGDRDPRGHGHGHGTDGFERGRKLSSDDLQLLILALLAERARHGYELIKEIEQRSGGWYVPSPGMIYPALSYLDDAGYASVEAAGAKKHYTISVAGLAWLDEHQAAVEALWAQLARFGERMGRAREDARFAEEASSEGRAQLHAALDALRDALREQRASTPEQLARIVAIVRRAAEDVRGGGAA
jgi:DNA-binding PadR family transcriptional regulator